MAEPRITAAVIAVFAALLQDVTEPRYGLEIAKVAELNHTTIYDTLARLEAARWLQSEWEKRDNHDQRPRRRLYRLTPLGESVAKQAIEAQFRTVTRGRGTSGWTPQPSGSS
jgi:DNA-binding PadR family transcriptional regulator